MSELSKRPSTPPPRIGRDKEPVPWIIRYLGEVVFLGWPKGVKGTRMKFKHLRLSHMTPDYLAKLKEGNIGVALGSVSGGLCVIDIDDPQYVRPMLDANPFLKDTFQTEGRPGRRGFWVRFTGRFPTTIEFQNKIGEFRSSAGNQSIVWGTHPETSEPYKWVVQKRVLELDFALIKWPDGMIPQNRLQKLSLKGEDSRGDFSGESCLKGNPPLRLYEVEVGVGGVGNPRTVGSGVEGCRTNSSDLDDSPNGKSRTISSDPGDCRTNGIRSVCLEIPEERKEQIERACRIGAAATKQNNNASFRACLALIEIRNVESLADMPQTECVYFATRWYEHLKSLGRLNPKKFKSHYMNDLFSSAKNANRKEHMKNQNPLQAAWQLAQTQPYPAEAAEFDGDPTMQKLIALCYQLHTANDKGEWFLARNMAGELMGLDETDTRALSYNINVLISCGILKVVKPYEKGKRIATTYRYVEQERPAQAVQEGEP